ncbi:MAG: lysophospholipid acyltransferase family protein [Anaerolineae bacterium]
MAKRSVKVNSKTPKQTHPRHSSVHHPQKEPVTETPIGETAEPTANDETIVDTFDLGAPADDETIVDTFDLGTPAQETDAPDGETEPDGIPADGEEEPMPQAAAEAEMPDPNLRQQLMHELDDMINRIRTLNPGYNPPPFSPRALVDLVQQNMDKLPSGFSLQILDQLRGSLGADLFDVDTWKGIWYVLNSTLQNQGDMLKRRVTGEYETDEWGMDPELRDAVRPFFDFMYKSYWRIETTGMENIPAEGRGLLVANHSGQLPWDGAMIAEAVLMEHPNNRLVRPLYATWFPTLPVIGDFLVKTGGVLATEDNGERLLNQDQLALVLPEGYKGVSKLFKERYRLARFGRGGFVQMALKARAPMIPVSVVGAEETYVSLHKSNTMAKLTGFPYFPISLTFPWFGLLGFVPLPTKWYIDIGAPIPTDGYKEGSENNPVLVSQLTDQIRNIVQEMIYARLAKRRSVFFK